MSRRLRKDRVRYWTKELEGKVEGDLRAWADRNKNVLDYDVQEFADKVPLHSQVVRKKCTPCGWLWCAYGHSAAQ